MLDPGGDTDRDRPPHPLRAGTAAGPARLLRRPAPASASGAGRHPDELAEDGLARLLDLAPAAALGAGRDRLRLAPRAVAARAGLGVPDLDLPFGSGNCLLERDLHPHEQVRAALRPAGRLPPRTAAEERVEDVAEAREVGGEPALEPAAAGVAALRGVRERLVAHPVVLGSLLGVGEGGVGLVDLLEPLLGAGLLADVGVVLPREVPVRLPDLLLVRCPGDPQAFVVVSGGHPLCAPTP